MTVKLDSEECRIRSFTCRCVVKNDDIYLLGPEPQLFKFFGTNPESYENGLISRIRCDISSESADLISSLCFKKAVVGEDFRIAYPSMRADGSRCYIQLDAYARDTVSDGRVYDIIGMDITKLIETQKTADKLAAENYALTDDSPVGLGIYHIKGNHFDLVYTNPEYYRVHHGSKQYWDGFKGKDALNRILAEDRHIIIDEWLRTVAKGGNHIFDAKYRCIGEDGSIHWIHLRGRLSSVVVDGMYTCYASYMNIDPEKEAEKLAENLKKNLIDTINKLPSISALYIVNDEKNIILQSLSEGFCRLTGFTKAEAWDFYASDAYCAIHPDEREKIKRFVSLHVGEKDPNHCSFRIMTGFGEYKWVSVRFVSFSVEDKNYLYAVYSDIDTIKKQEEEIEKQYIDAQAFLDSISDTYLLTMRANITENKVEIAAGSFTVQPENNSVTYDYVVDRFLEMLPRESDKIEFKKLFLREAVLKQYLNGNTSISHDFYVKSPSGNTCWAKCSMNLLPRPSGSSLIAFITAEDITKTKVLDTIINNVLINQYDFISCIDVEQNSIEIISINQQSAAVNEVHGGSDYDKIMREYVKQHVVADEKEACIRFMTLSNVLKELENKNNCSASFTVLEDGTLRNKRLDYSYIDRESKLITLIRTDFTEMQKKQLEQEEKLRTALSSAQQASIAKSAFLSRMSHEIRTPMNAIIGMDTLAAQAIGNDERVSDCIGKIGISARYLLSLINDILDMSRIESGKMLLKNDRFTFRDFVSGINTIIYNQTSVKGLDYECIVSNEIDESYIGDAMKLQQVLINVLGNAVKFTKKGKVSLEIAQLSKTDKVSKLRFIVNDTGCGISEENIEKIFRPFEQVDTSTTTSFGGTGLGLAITKNLVNLMGGVIRVRSIVGVGSEFTIDIPLTIDDSIVVQPKTFYNLEKLHTLVVDDDIIICEQTSSILKDIGMIGEWVTSGHEAVERVRINSEKAAFYDFILIDWKMPDMDGIETTRQIRSIVGPDVTIIIISAYDWEAIEADAKAAGANMLISKPLFKSTLISAFQKAKGNAEKEPLKEIGFDFTGKRIMLVEDNQINAEIAKALLEAKHFMVEVAPNGLKALEMFTKTPVGFYDAILMDVRMPIMDGLQATNNIRHWSKDDAKTIPIIAMTANAFDEDVEKSRAAGMNAHLSKPIEPEILYRTLYRIINENQ